MSKYTEYYYYNIKRMLMNKDNLPKNRMQVAIFNNAVEDALEETRKLPNGELRIKAIDMILFKQTHTYEGVAQVIHYDWRTIQNWITSFVNLVGRKAGF